jgi:predicted transcriptional regulator of viral defense system
MRSDARPDVLAARLAGERWGVLSLDELRACGLSPETISRRVGRGHLHPMHRGVYAVGHAGPPLEGRWPAAVKACGSAAVLSHFSAAALWGIVEWAERHPEVTVDARAPRRHPGVRVHRSSMLTVADVTRHRGIPVTSPGRTLLDLAATLEDTALRRAVRNAESLQRVNVRRLAELLARVGSGRGTRRLAGIVATGPAPTRSELENVVLDLILGAEIERPAVNVPIALGGRRLIPDFRWPSQRVIVEADGAAWHDGRTAREQDAERQALLEAHGRAGEPRDVAAGRRGAQPDAGAHTRRRRPAGRAERARPYAGATTPASPSIRAACVKHSIGGRRTPAPIWPPSLPASPPSMTGSTPCSITEKTSMPVGVPR